MGQHGSAIRRHHQDDRPSPAVSRLIVLVFVTAGALGLLAGAGWMAWTWMRRGFGG